MNDVSSFLDPVLAQAGVRELAEAPAASVPPGYKIESLSRFHPATDAAGHLGLLTLACMVAYVKAQGAGPASAIFADREGKNIVAVIDWHAEAESKVPGWGRHRANYKLELTPEWQAWNGISGRPQPQAVFAEFVEENLPDIVEPDAATVLEVARNLSGNRKVKFGSARNLSNGDVALQWIEETEAGAGPNQETKVPSELKLKLPVFRGAERATTFEVKAFLRYRIKDGALSFEVKLHRPEKAIDLAFDEVVAALRSELSTAEVSDVPVYLGAVAKWPAEILP
jgi:uncharacterized protein YfdQ (DUF2303 family)